MARIVSSGLARSIRMWFSAPPGQGQRASKGCREQVSTRQPCAENVLTVAWPIPRLAPVSSITLPSPVSAMPPSRRL